MVKFLNSRIKEYITENSLLCRNAELLLRLKDKQQCLDFTSISNEAYFKIIFFYSPKFLFLRKVEWNAVEGAIIIPIL